MHTEYNRLPCVWHKGLSRLRVVWKNAHCEHCADSVYWLHDFFLTNIALYSVSDFVMDELAQWGDGDVMAKRLATPIVCARAGPVAGRWRWAFRPLTEVATGRTQPCTKCSQSCYWSATLHNTFYSTSRAPNSPSPIAPCVFSLLLESKLHPAHPDPNWKVGPYWYICIISGNLGDWDIKNIFGYLCIYNGYLGYLLGLLCNLSEIEYIVGYPNGYLIIFIDVHLNFFISIHIF